MPGKENGTKRLQNLNHIITEAYVEGKAALDRLKSELPAGTYRQLDKALSKSYKAGREVVKLSSKKRD